MPFIRQQDAIEIRGLSWIILMSVMADLKITVHCFGRAGSGLYRIVMLARCFARGALQLGNPA